ncbi:MAG: hypothetical protein ACRDBQ_18750 [Shewanella sp.]
MDDISKVMATDPAIRAVLQKATSASPAQQRGRREQGGTTPTRSEVTSIAGDRIRNTRNAQRIYQALPEMETIVTVAASSLLSSKDLVNTSLIHECVAEIPIDLRDDLIRAEREFHDNVKKLPRKLYKWIYDALKSKGATPVLILSDSGFDSLFGLDSKVVRESFRNPGPVKNSFSDFFTRQRGVLGKIGEAKVTKGSVMALESIFGSSDRPTEPQTLQLDLSSIFSKGDLSTFDLTVTDNVNMFLMPEVVRRVAQENARNSIINPFGTDPYEGSMPNTTTPTEIPTPFDKEKGNNLKISDLNETYDQTPSQMPYAEISKPSLSDVNRTEATERILPADTLLPMILGDDVMNPIGYIAIIDDAGNFLNGRSSMYGDAQFMNMLNSTGGPDSVINRASLGLADGIQTYTPEIANRLLSRFGEVAETQLASALGQALGGVELDMNVTETFTRIMLTRHLSKRHTQIVYIPAENVAYFATDFNDDGFGVSIAERSFVISTVRMSLLFATMNTAILNSARNMQFDIELSPDAANAEELVARAKSDILNSYNRAQPMWGDLNDVYSLATNSGIAFNIIGNEFYPSTKVSVSDTTPDYKMPDKEIDESLLRRTCHIAGVDPDLILTPENIEFASQIFSKSLLVTQQIIKKQEILQVPLTRYVTTSIISSPSLQAELIRICVEYIKDKEPNVPEEKIVSKASEYIGKFINGIRISLPPPDTSAAASQMDLFDKRVEFFEKLADLVVTDDIASMLQNSGIDLEPDTVKSMVKTFYTRSWLKKQGIETDFFDLIYDKDKRPENVKMISDEIQEASETIIQLALRTGQKIETLAKRRGAEGTDADDYSGDTPPAGDDTNGLDDIENDPLAEGGDDLGNDLDENPNGLVNDDESAGLDDLGDTPAGTEEEKPAEAGAEEDELDNI